MAALRHGFLVALLGLAVSLIAGCVTLETETDARLDKTVETLLEAIRARDDSVILSLAANPQAFGENGRLQDDVAGFLYDGDHVRGFNPEARSVVEIIALGPLRVHIVREKGGPAAVISSPKPPRENAQVVMVESGGRATVLFVPEQFEEQLQVDSFYSERWMRDYFACEFHLIDGRWVLLYNICFAGSGGPYHEPYGMWRAPESAPREFAAVDPEPQSLRERFEA
jgi:hypothetical protein